MPSNAYTRSEHGRLAALAKRAKAPSGASLTEAKRQKFLDNFSTRHECKLCGVVEIDQSAPEKDRRAAAKAAYKAHMTRISHRRRVLHDRAKAAFAEAKTLADAV